MSEPSSPSGPLDEDARLAQAVRALGSELEPPEGWRAQVLARVDAAAAPRRSRAWIYAGEAVLAAAVLLLVWRSFTPTATSEQGNRPVVAVAPPTTPRAGALPIVDTEVIEHGNLVRGRGAHVGDTWRIRASVGSASHVVIHVYRGDRVVWNVRCPGDAPLVCANGMAETSLVLDGPGSYRAVTIASDAALPAGEPAAVLDAALRQGARVEWSVTLEVR